MKHLLIGACALVSLVANASTEGNPAEALLHQMDQATEQLDYELSYILVRKNSIEPLRFRHARIDDKSFGHIAYLAGPPREVIRRGDEVSYFEPGIDPFTIESNQMVAPLPAIMQSDIEHLATLYDFVPLGRAREAGLACDVVRVSPKDGTRYSYVLWIDQNTKLLVRSDLLDRDGEPIEQYRALSLVISSQVGEMMKQMSSIELPPVVQVPKQQDLGLNWQVTALPDGFSPIYSNRHRLMITKRPVESQMFSDGLFSFSVYLSEADDFSVREQLVRKGRRTLHSQVSGNAEITVVGDIPPATAKRVAESVRMTAPNKTKGKQAP
ncbi:sigma-E factor regulatory protein RseB [Grimontia hollisae]|uniref:Sigma factor RpoE negative regulatory protein RseB n=2 Tax=Grimontia hollisae TaxID=673 RepID=D0I4M4_GRIHO|nr:sigma-E factor regulatory protein RseB [Grimontia hollisae]AMG30150.1 sigma-E factor regulatory protein RseB [Grimontia hollisae]EEY73441.1 sigma factor RpoE negative regulatory protein RseB precursor [Grimontia hollisae CIP 101886]MDF2184547.1 sigma-E factor regulatory protein RseB [Grimontia hollisae]STO42610.1 Sigma-E factor regulatory protein rseB precursor [Grimontia hollisae]STO56489.1 Sigma-E factor regulatory protein rseB precursor [Grimontia hollisae]